MSDTISEDTTRRPRQNLYLTAKRLLLVLSRPWFWGWACVATFLGLGLYSASGVFAPEVDTAMALMYMPIFLVVEALRSHPPWVSIALASVAVALGAYSCIRWRGVGRELGRFALASVVSIMIAGVAGEQAWPMKLTFRAHKAEFEAALGRMPDGIERCSESIGRYRFHSWGRDPLGGEYFETSTVLDNWSPVSGFVHAPNERGTPWGAGKPQLTRLTGDWYYFVVP